MATLSGIITPTNVETASSTSTLTNKTINGASNTITNVSLSTGVTGTLPVANGGTGAATLTANNVLLGNGTSAVQMIAPGASGNILTSNGTTWASTTPAAPAGTVSAVASGSIASGAPVVINSNGTVSSITATASTGSTLSSVNVSSTTYPAKGLYGGSETIVYGSTSGAVVAFYIGSNTANNYIYASIGLLSGTTYSWSAPFVVYSTACQELTSGGFDSANNRYWCCVRDSNNYGYFIGVKLDAQGAYVSVVNTYLNAYAGDTVSRPTMQVGADGTKGVFTYYANNYAYLFAHGFSFTANAPYITQGNYALISSSFYSYATNNSMAIAVNADVSKAVCLILDPSQYPTALLIGITNNNATLNNTSVIQSSAAYNGYGVAYSPTDDKFVAVWGISSPSWNARAATITVSGNSMSFGTVLTGGMPYPYASSRQLIYNQTLNNFMVFGDSSSNSLTISGTTLTAASGVYFTGASSGTVATCWLINDSYAQVQYLSTTTYYMQVTIARPYTSTLNNTNLLGISDAAYTNGQTATIKIVGSTKNGFSGLTSGVKYNVNGTGALQPLYAIGGSYIGLALSSSTLLIKG